MKKKTFMTLILSLTLCMTLLAGCGGGAAAGGSSGGSAEAAEEEGTEDAGDKIPIEFWYSGGKSAVAVVEEIITDFNASQDKYVVSSVTQGSYDETYQSLQAAIAGKTAPDVVLLDTDVSRSLSDKELVIDLAPLLAKDDSYNPDDYLAVYADQGKDENGRVYALPAYGTTQVMYYNKAAFEEAGVNAEDIKTWQDLADAARKIKEGGNFEFGWEPMWGRDNLIDAAFSNGAKVFSDDGKTVTINTPEWVEVWEAFRGWIHDEEIMAIHSGGQGWEYWYNTIDDVLEGIAGGYTGSSGDQADLDFGIVAAMEQPAWDDDSQSAPMAEALLLDILASSSEEEQQGAYEFVRYFTSVPAQAKWTMATGYVAVNTKTAEDPDYAAFLEENPQAGVPFSQSAHASVYPFDPTNGAVIDALSIACDKVEIEGISAQEALDEAQATAQAALDEALGN